MATNQEKIDYLLSIKPEDTGPTNEEKKAYLLQQEQSSIQPKVMPQETEVPQVGRVEPSFVETLPFMDRGQIAEPQYNMTPSFGDKDFSELTENVFKSLDNIGLGAARTVGEITDTVMSKWLGEITSIPSAIAGVKFASKLPVGHPLLKGLSIITGSAGGSGIGQFFGELGEDVWNGTAVDYDSALKEGVNTAKWDIYGGLALGTLGTISKKALRLNGIESTDDAVKVGREILQKYGADLSWYQATGSNISSVMEGIGRVGLFGKETLDRSFKKQESALQQNLEELFTPTTIEDFGKNVQQVLTDSTQALRKEYSPQYDAIYESGKNIPIDLRQYNSDIVKRIEKASGARKNKKAPSSNSIINEVNSIVAGLDDITNMSMLNQNLIELRSLKRTGFEARTTVGNVGGNYANEQIKKLESIMGEAAQKLDPSLKGKLDFLNKNYAIATSKLKSKTMRIVAKKDPAKVGDWVYSNPAKHKEFMLFLGQARNLKTITKEQHMSILNDYRSGYMKKQIAEEAATTQSMSALAKKLRIAKNHENLASVLGHGMTNRFKNILSTAELTQKSVGAKLGLVIGGQQAAAAKGAVLATAAYTMSLPAVLALFTGPMAMAKAASTAKTMGEWLSINAGLKKAIDSGDVTKINVIIKRITQYAGEAEEPTESTGNEL